jgi:signal transduction histidine kinase
MISANIPQNEKKRLQDLHESRLLDSPQEEEFNEIVKFASSLCNMPISLISLVDSNRQWFKARVGLNVSETSRDISFCSHAILQDHIFEIPDTLDDVRFNDNPLVINDPSIRFYAGVPLVTSSGSRLGTLCVIDKVPGQLNEKQRLGLTVLASNVIKITELRIKNKELHYLADTQKRIISILAHDVRNPLASIKNIIELKQSDVLDINEAAEMMGMVAGQLNSTIDMVENIVNWGQLHLQFGTLKFNDFDLHDLVDRVFGSESLNSMIKNNKLVNLTQEGTFIYSDQNILEFILRNLVGNANKFTKNGSISVSSQQTGGKTILCIADTGVGMTDEQAEALLKNNIDAAVRSTPGTDMEKGNGLGLLLVKEFIDRIDGTITVESSLNSGTTFKIVLQNG